MTKITWTNCQVKLSDLKDWPGNPAEISKEVASLDERMATAFSGIEIEKI